MGKKIGFIGLGVMGKPMGKNLLRAGYDLVVHDIRKEPVEELVDAGAQSANSPREVAERTEVIITMLPDSPEVKEVVLGKDGVLEGAREGSILIDMSSIAPSVTIEIASELKKKGIRMLDAPVSGGEPGAIQGTLAIMVGGTQEDFEECAKILNVMGGTVTRVGNIGAGNVTKLANQVIVALNIAAMSEAMALATKSGVDPEQVYNAIRSGLAGSNVLDAKMPLVLERRFEPGFRINLHIKDLSNALEAGAKTGVPMPLTGLVMQVMQALKVDGLGDMDHGAIALFHEKLAGVEIRPSQAVEGGQKPPG